MLEKSRFSKLVKRVRVPDEGHSDSDLGCNLAQISDLKPDRNSVIEIKKTAFLVKNAVPLGGTNQSVDEP